MGQTLQQALERWLRAERGNNLLDGDVIESIEAEGYDDGGIRVVARINNPTHPNEWLRSDRERIESVPYWEVADFLSHLVSEKE
jgi:hypothetical protein